jgi:hypothetical protein
MTQEKVVVIYTSDIQKVIPSPTDQVHEIEVGQQSRLMMMRAYLKTSNLHVT